MLHLRCLNLLLAHRAWGKLQTLRLQRWLANRGLA